MTPKYEVEAFLQSFRQKVKIWGLLVADSREVNSKALVELELSPLKREETITSLTINNYSEGPSKPNYGTDIWIFGQTREDKEIYIKLTLGEKGTPALCISFHTADYPLTYPFKR